MVDLWADDIAITDIKPPVAILKEQATLLGNKTQNTVLGEIISFKAYDSPNSEIIHKFNVVAPALGNYSFELFLVSHNVDLYPLEITMDEKIFGELSSGETPLSSIIRRQNITARLYTVSADSEEMFVNFLGGILKSNRAKKIVRSLLAQSTHDMLNIAF